MKKFLTIIACILIAFIVFRVMLLIVTVGLDIWEDYKRNHMEPTTYQAPCPCIAIDIEEEYKDDYLRILWKISKDGHIYPYKPKKKVE